MSETVIRKVTNNVWTFSRCVSLENPSTQFLAKMTMTFASPFSRFGFIPVGGRSTAVRLSNGNVWILASTPLDVETKAKLDELGPVKYIIGPDAEHSMYLGEISYFNSQIIVILLCYEGEFKRAYPDAKLVGVEEHTRKPHLLDVNFDGCEHGSIIIYC